MGGTNLSFRSSLVGKKKELGNIFLSVDLVVVVVGSPSFFFFLPTRLKY